MSVLELEAQLLELEASQALELAEALGVQLVLVLAELPVELPADL